MNQRMSNQDTQKVSRWAPSIAAQNPKIQEQIEKGSRITIQRQCKHTYTQYTQLEETYPSNFISIDKNKLISVMRTSHKSSFGIHETPNTYKHTLKLLKIQSF